MHARKEGLDARKRKEAPGLHCDGCMCASCSAEAGGPGAQQLVSSVCLFTMLPADIRLYWLFVAAVRGGRCAVGWRSVHLGD
jgi:hypothetical protein